MTAAERLARNEAVFRSVNERILEAAGNHATDGHVYEFVCECSTSTCLERVRLTVGEYETIRASGVRFVLATGHERPAVESVVAVRTDHVVVEKVGIAGMVAESLDPRSPAGA